MAGMKPFRRELKLYQIHFEDDPDLKGFEALMRGVSVEKFVEVTELSSLLEAPGGKTRENIERQFTMLAEQLVEWNYCDEDGNAFPADYDGLRRLDVLDAMKLMYAWMQAIASVPKASNSDSPFGEISEELSLGLGSASRGQAS